MSLIAILYVSHGILYVSPKSICREFCDYFQKLFSRELNLSLTQFENYLTDFPHLKVIEVAGCKSHIIEKEIWKALKLRL